MGDPTKVNCYDEDEIMITLAASAAAISLCAYLPPSVGGPSNGVVTWHNLGENVLLSEENYGRARPWGYNLEEGDYVVRDGEMIEVVDLNLTREVFTVQPRAQNQLLEDLIGVGCLPLQFTR